MNFFVISVSALDTLAQDVLNWKFGPKSPDTQQSVIEQKGSAYFFTVCQHPISSVVIYDLCNFPEGQRTEMGRYWLAQSAVCVAKFSFFFSGWTCFDMWSFRVLVQWSSKMQSRFMWKRTCRSIQQSSIPSRVGFQRTSRIWMHTRYRRAPGVS